MTAEGPHNLLHAKTFQELVALYLKEFRPSYSVFNQVQHILCPSWTGLWREMEQSFDVNGTIVQPFGPMVFEAVKSTMAHERTEMICFFIVQVGNRMVIKYCNASLMYGNLNYDKDVDMEGRGGHGVCDPEGVPDVCCTHQP